MRGDSDLLEVFPDRLTITPKGILGLMLKGLKGTKVIPFKSISAIQFKEAGLIFSGYLQFTIPGGLESRQGSFDAATDENTVKFAREDLNPIARQIKEHIEAAILEMHAPRTGRAATTPSLADEIAKLGDLRVKGILTEQEFLAAKAKLLAH